MRVIGVFFVTIFKAMSALRITFEKSFVGDVFSLNLTEIFQVLYLGLLSSSYSFFGMKYILGSSHREILE